MVYEHCKPCCLCIDVYVYDVYVSLVVYVLMPTVIFPNSLQLFHVAFQLAARSQLYQVQCSLS